MARIFSSGFEENEGSGGATGEWSAVGGVSNAASPNRSGSFAGILSTLSSGSSKYRRITIADSTSPGPFYARTYLYIDTLPSAENGIMQFATGSINTRIVGITLDNTGVLRLYDANGVIGSPSAILNIKTWYRVELVYDASGSSGNRIAQAYLNGVSFAAESNGTFSNGVVQFLVGGNLLLEAQTVGKWYFDDVAINDNTGTTQVNLPGNGSLVYLRPSAVGDNNAFGTQVGGTAGATNNFTRVNEFPANDATSYNAELTLNNIDDFNIDDTPSTIGNPTLITLIHIAVRFAGAAASANAGFKVRCKKTSGGTVSESAEIVPASASWVTDVITGTNSRKSFPLTLYSDPDGNAWTKATLDTAQIGYRISTNNTNNAQISGIWMLVEYADPTYQSIYGGSVPNTSITMRAIVVGY